MAHNSVTGPIPRDEFAAMVEMPHGKAREAIRKYDPLWGRETGEVIKWEVRFTRKVRERGYATVEAATEKEAEKLADKIPESQIFWDVGDDCDDIEVVSVEPKS